MRGCKLPHRFQIAALIVTACLGAGQAGAAQTLPAQPKHEETSFPGQLPLAMGPWSRTTGFAGETLTGDITTQVWQIPDEGRSTLQFITALTSEAQAGGYAPLFACETAQCGGFDFRFAITVLPEPVMHVDLGDFRYAALKRETAKGPEHQVFLVSRGPDILYVQVTTIRPVLAAGEAKSDPEPTTSATQIDESAAPPPALAPAAPAPAGTLIADLQNLGSAALDDLVFAPAAAELLAGDYASLTELGAWLQANPAVTVAFVGHSDATGGLAGNVALSTRRAESVRAWVQGRFDLPPGQTRAEGVGFLSPRASNATPEGQAKNRRVEVMITSTP